ncbi:MAG TPA: o-succinylbenzoate synthase [Bryobacteraceae bacterium]|nr:o-succinylbenzoate synthase [Bryobacteraceae bacterium]
MKIDRAVVTHIRVPFVEPFRISSGVVAEKDAIVLELHSDGLTGYGESSAMAGSFYSADTPEKSWTELCERVLPAIIGRDFEGPQNWNLALDELRAGNFTKAGVETAFWDLEAQIQNKPLHVVLGGRREQVESGLAVGLYDNLSDMLRAIERYLVDGYRRVKVKIEPGRDIKVVNAIRNAFGDIPLFVDANGAYTPEQVDVFRALDEFGLLMFEQPYPGSFLEESAELQQLVRTPICLDESLETLEQLMEAIRLDSFRIANFKIQRVGGFYRALEMDRICCKHGLAAWVGTMPELGIGQAQGVALASLDNFVYATDVEASDRWFRDDIVHPFIQVRNGVIDLPSSPGLGVKIDRAKMQTYEVGSRSFPE